MKNYKFLLIVAQTFCGGYNEYPSYMLLAEIRQTILALQIEYSAFLHVSTKLIFLACIR